MHGFTKVFRYATTRPLALTVLGAGILGALALASWPIGALGAVAYGALVASDLTSIDVRRRVLLGKATPKGLPKPAAIADAEVREAVAAIAGARAEVDRTLAATPQRIARHVTTSLRAIDELVAHGANLAQRGDELATFLATVKVAEIEAEAARLGERGEEATDPGAREEYKHAAAAARERLASVREIQGARERILANLARITAAIRGVPTKLVRLRALDDQASDQMTMDVGDELERMNIDLRAFEDTLAAIVEVPT